jgi:uncharacterized membrane protein (DUF2068 family)
MDKLLILLQHLGLGRATYPIYELIKGIHGATTTEDNLAHDIQSRIDRHGRSVDAKTVIHALARNGFISIQNSDIHANEAVVFGSIRGGASTGFNGRPGAGKTAVQA